MLQSTWAHEWLWGGGRMEIGAIQCYCCLAITAKGEGIQRQAKRLRLTTHINYWPTERARGRECSLLRIVVLLILFQKRSNNVDALSATTSEHAGNVRTNFQICSKTICLYVCQYLWNMWMIRGSNTVNIALTLKKKRSEGMPSSSGTAILSYWRNALEERGDTNQNFRYLVLRRRYELSEPFHTVLSSTRI